MKIENILTELLLKNILPESENKGDGTKAQLFTNAAQNFDIIEFISSNNEAAKEALDINGDGQISQSEKDAFESFVKNFNKDITNMTLEDLLNEFSKANQANNKAKENNVVQNSLVDCIETGLKNLFTSSASTVSSTSNTSSCKKTSKTTSSAPAYTANSCPTSNTNVRVNTNLTNMSLEELEEKKTEEKSKVNESRENINKVHTGDNDVIRTAQSRYDEAQKAYENALENDKEVKAELKAQLKENNSAIQEKEGEIEEINTNINDKEGEISEQESTIASNESTLQELKTQLSAFSSQSSDDPDEKARINAVKEQLRSAIQSMEQQIESDKEKLNSLNDELKELQDKIPVAEDELSELESKKEQIEKEIQKSCSPETIKTMREANNAKKQVETAKTTELNRANNELKSAEQGLNQVETEIISRSFVVDDSEWEEVAKCNIDLTEKLENGEPRYVFAQGTQDKTFHIYDLSACNSLTTVDQGNNKMYNFCKTEDNSGKRVCYMDSCDDICTFNACYNTNSPLSFDLNGDGVKTSDELVQFDIDGDGIVDTINNSADAVLVFDADGDGISGESGLECFGDNTDLDGDGKADGFANGFDALKALAKKENLINGVDDNKLDENDLKILEEKYGLKIKTGGYNSEATSLFDAGITEINLATTDDVELQKNYDGKQNDLMTQEGATFVVNGEEREYADLWHSKKDV